MPLVLWGSRCWRILTAVIVAFLLVFSIYTIGTDIMMGHVLWWYNLSILLFATALLALLFLVKEGLKTFDNVVKYGLHPKTKAQFEREAPTDAARKSDVSLQELVDEPPPSDATKDREAE